MITVGKYKVILYSKYAKLLIKHLITNGEATTFKYILNRLYVVLYNNMNELGILNTYIPKYLCFVYIQNK